MEPIIFDGNNHMKEIRIQLQTAIANLVVVPELHIIIVGFHPVIERFVRMKKKFGTAIGVPVHIHRIDVHITTEACQQYIKELVAKNTCIGIIVQLPLPEHMDTQAVLDMVPAQCDVDVLGSAGQELFVRGENPMIPTVARAIGYAIDTQPGITPDMNVVIVGNGKLVGAPTASYLRQRDFAPWVFDKESDPQAYTEALTQAQLVITGVGRPGLIQPDQIRDGLFLIDAGTSEGEGILQGDIDPECYAHARWYTPVPGGIGPLTVAMIFMNLYEGYKKV
jgi:methylenetetrahydrofolate dehydrogenase (NADP+)/methenyltetrahydrofolate cyclohydrolase